MGNMCDSPFFTSLLILKKKHTIMNISWELPCVKETYFHHGTVVLHVVQLFHRRLHGGGVREVREGVAFGRLGVLRNQRNARTDSLSGQNVHSRIFAKSKDVKIRILRNLASEPTNSVRKKHQKLCNNICQSRNVVCWAGLRVLVQNQAHRCDVAHFAKELF